MSDSPLENYDDVPTHELVARALQVARGSAGEQPETYWLMVGTLHGRGTETELDAASALLLSTDPIERELGCDILGQLGWGNPTFVEESVSLLIERLGDQHPRVVSSAAYSLGHRRSPRAIEPALGLIHHCDENIRRGIVASLSCHDRRDATDALIQLSRDLDRDVRDWATFGLGSMCNADYPELREALRACLGDQDAEIRSEAMVGLALPKDSSVLLHIKAALESGDVIAGYLSAAEAAANSELLPALLKSKSQLHPEETGYWVSVLEGAIAACQPA